MSGVMGQWSKDAWNAELDDDPELKQLIESHYHLNPVAAVGDDYGFTTTTLGEESEQIRQKWMKRFLNLAWVENPIMHFVNMTNRGESALNVSEGFNSVLDTGLHKVTNIFGHPSMADLRITKNSEAQRMGRGGRTGNAVILQLYSDSYDRNSHEIVVGGNVYGSLPFLATNNFARSTSCLNDRNFLGVHFFSVLFGLAKLRSGRLPVAPDSRGYCFRPDFEEMNEWEIPATVEEIIDALNEERWTNNTLEVSRRQCMDLVVTDDERKLRFLT